MSVEDVVMVQVGDFLTWILLLLFFFSFRAAAHLLEDLSLLAFAHSLAEREAGRDE